MIKKTLLKATAILFICIVGTLLLSRGISEEEKYKLIQVAEFEVPDPESFSVAGNNLLLISKDLPEYENKAAVYQPKVWYEKTLENGISKTEYKMRDNRLIINNQQDVTLFNYIIRDNFIYNSRESFYYSSYSGPRTGTSTEPVINELFRESRNATVTMPFIIYY